MILILKWYLSFFNDLQEKKENSGFKVNKLLDHQFYHLKIIKHLA